MHNNIMAAGSKDRLPILAPGRYPQWRSWFLRYVDTRPNVREHTTVETPMNMSPENKAYFLAEKEAIHLILTGIRDDIYSTVNACQIAHEMWEAIERTVNVVADMENVGSKVVQQSGIQCFNCKEYAHFAKECRKPKRVKDSIYNKEKMLFYKAKIQEVPTADSGTDSEPVEQNEQNDVESDNERVALANLIANLKLNVDENKKTQKQLKTTNTTLAQELRECKVIIAETSKSLGESISVRDSFLLALQTKQAEFEKYKVFTVPLTMTNLNVS
nr:hypothetical protein [Tanacetum cinerariifolium]